MGAEVNIRLLSDKYDDKRLAPFLGRDFHREIARGEIWKNIEPFLTTEESELLDAPYDEILETDFPSSISPLKLLKVLEKVKSFLSKEKENLPYEITVDYEKMEALGLNYVLVINNSHCWIQGDSFHYDVLPKVTIVNFPHEPNEVDFKIDVATKVEIEGEIYFLKKTFRDEKFAIEIDGAIQFCNYAHQKNERIYWFYSH